MTLGIVAGSGDLPAILAKHCDDNKKPYYVAALEGCADIARLSSYTGDVFPLGKIGAMLKAFKQAHVSEIIMIGGVKRPSFSSLRLDATALRWMYSLRNSITQGDDALLTAVASLLEKEGFRVCGFQDVLPELLMPQGVLGHYAPSEQNEKDIKKGMHVAKTLGQLDIGQAVIVEKGNVLSVEGIEGTDALICRTQALKREQGGVLVKCIKPQQDRRLDLPTIGLTTLDNAKRIGLSGIALQSGALLVHRERVIEKANALGLFVCGVS